MNKVYFEMLQDAGVPISEKGFNIENNNLESETFNPDYCRNCSNLLNLYNSCDKCGLVSNISVLEREPYSWNYDKTKNCGYEIIRKRSYLPLTHFKDHMRRYLGEKLKNIPEPILNMIKKEVNIFNKNSYTKIRKILKREKCPQLYPEIFSIIYDCGGHVPKISGKIMRDCYHNFEMLMYKFCDKRSIWKRHSMPSNYMILDILLKRNGHKPYYNLPKLKSTHLRKQAERIINELLSLF